VIADASAAVADRAAAPVASADRSMVLALRVMPARPAIRAAARAKETSAPARRGHLGQAWRQRAAGQQAELPVAGREPALARRAVIPRAGQAQRAEHRGDGPGPAARVVRLVARRALSARAGVAVIAVVEDGLQQPSAGSGERGAHRLLQRAQRGARAEH